MAPAVWLLGATQIIGYGTLQYAFGSLAPEMAADFGWSEEWVFLALSFSLLVGGLVAPVSGAWADRFGAGRVMAWGSVGAAVSLAACAVALEGISFIAALTAMAVASAFVLYATAFAALAELAGTGAQRSITHLTLIAGFASTIFWPLTSSLQDVLGWREIYASYAVLNLLVAAPLHLWLSRYTVRRRATEAIARTAAVPLLSVADERLTLALLLGGFAMLGFVLSAILMHMVPLLGSIGLGAAGVFVASVFGPAQVLSRLVNMQFGRGLSQPIVGIIAASLPPLALAVLALSAPALAGAAIFALLFGLGSGLSSIVSGTLPLALFGSSGYGRRLGLISSARQIAAAIAPAAFSLSLATFATQASLWLAALAGLIGTGCFVAIWAICRPQPRTAVA